MTIEERKQKTYEGLQLLENIHTEEDIEKYSDFDLEKGLDIIELF